MLLTKIAKSLHGTKQLKGITYPSAITTGILPVRKATPRMQGTNQKSQGKPRMITYKESLTQTRRPNSIPGGTEHKRGQRQLSLILRLVFELA